MRIEEKTVYVIGGHQFDSVEKAESFEADCIGAFMEKNLLAGIVFHPRDRIKLLENILANRVQLRALLTQE